MALLNYSTSIGSGRTMGEIAALLVQAGARKIATDYDSEGNALGLNFVIEVPGGFSAFSLPVRSEAIFIIMNGDRTVPQKFKTQEQAQRIAWRIIKDWLKAQLALIETGMVTFEEVMLPYMRSTDGRSLYALYQEGTLAPMLGTGEQSIRKK